MRLEESGTSQLIFCLLKTFFAGKRIHFFADKFAGKENNSRSRHTGMVLRVVKAKRRRPSPSPTESRHLRKPSPKWISPKATSELRGTCKKSGIRQLSFLKCV